MRNALAEKPGVVETVIGMIDRIVMDPERREKIKEAVVKIETTPSEQLLSDDEDFLLVIKAIRFSQITISRQN
jgi:hypothetical protein